MNKKSIVSTSRKHIDRALKPLSLSLLLFAFSFQAFGQSLTMELKTDSVLFLGINNPLKIISSDLETDDMKVAIENGKIRKTDSGYIVIPGKKGESKITVYLDGDELLHKVYPVHELPSPVAILKSMEKPIGNIVLTLGTLIDEKGIKATLPNCVLDVDFEIVSFNIKVTGVGGTTLIEFSESDDFTESQLNIMKRMRPGQEIIIEEIKAIGPDGLKRDLEPIHIWIK